MRLILIRHSKTARDPHIPICQWGLSEEGIERAMQLASHPNIREIEVLYASFQTKALETAVLLAKPNAIPIHPDDGLTEVTSFTGPFDPDFDRYTKNVHDFYFDQIDRIQGGETKSEALQRFNTTLEKIVQAEQGKNTIGIVSHGNILALFAAQYMDVDHSTISHSMESDIRENHEQSHTKWCWASCYELHKTIEQPDIAIFDWESKKFLKFFGEAGEQIQ